MRKKRRKFWIKDAVKPRKKGALHRQLGVPQNQTIPKTLLKEVKKTKVGKTVQNPCKTGKRRMKVTRLLKRRAVLAHTLREF